jgi:hypothetical protein
MKQGPNVGRNPLSPGADISDRLRKQVPMKSSLLSLSLRKDKVMCEREREREGGEEISKEMRF